MAIYDTDANATTAVAAFLAQFSISAGGDIRFVSGSDTFHVKWLHRSLQHKVWDFTVSGDDNVNMAKPNPSTSEALGTIITLQDHTTNYSVRYNIDDTAAESFFGGSVEQTNVSSQLERYSGLIVVGAVNSAGTELQIIQDEALVTSFWGTGLNQTSSATLLRILVKSIVAGASVDAGRIVVKASEWFDTYAIWDSTILGLGEAVAAINTAADPQNPTALATVQAWTGFSGVAATLEGWDLIDVDGNGSDPFLGSASYAGLTGNTNSQALHEVVKAYLVRGTTDTIFGIDGDLWTGRVYQVTIDAGSGTHVQNETIDWVTGNGHLLAVDDTDGTNTTRMVLHLASGVPPVDNDVITGNGSATATVDTTIQTITTAPDHLGLWTGSNWIGAQGIGFNELIFGDSVTALDGQTPSVPQNVTITINVEVNNAAHDAHVFLAKKDSVLDSPDYTTLTAVGETIGSGNIDVNETIPADTPQTGWVGVLKTGTTAYKFYEYDSWTGSQFSLVGTVADDAITASDDIFVGFFYDSATGGGTSKTIARTFVFDSGTQDYFGWVRHGLETAPDKVIPLSFNVGSNNVTQNVVLDAET